MRAEVDYYALLGVASDVDAEELRRRYRELVRANHPDVAPDREEAHRRFIAIVEAYRTLSDPQRRRAYDALRASHAPAPPSRVGQMQRQIDDWFRHAVHRMEHGDTAGAAAQCRKILALDPDHGAAHAMLGDIHAAREDWDTAMVHFSSAVAAAPRNPVYARKLREAAEAGQRQRQAEERRQRRERQREAAFQRLAARHVGSPYVTIIGCGWVTTLLIWALLDPGQNIVWWFPLPLHWSAAAVAIGSLTGALLGLHTPLRPARPGPAPPGDRWALLTASLVAVFSFYASLALYCTAALAQQRTTSRVTVAYLATAVCLLVMCGLGTVGAAGEIELWRPTAMWGGNLIFPAVAAGRWFGRLGLRTVA